METQTQDTQTPVPIQKQPQASSRNSGNTKLLGQIIIIQGKYTASWGRVLWCRHKVCARGCDCIIPGKVKQRAAYFPD